MGRAILEPTDNPNDERPSGRVAAIVSTSAEHRPQTRPALRTASLRRVARPRTLIAASTSSEGKQCTTPRSPAVTPREGGRSRSDRRGDYADLSSTTSSSTLERHDSTAPTAVSGEETDPQGTAERSSRAGPVPDGQLSRDDLKIGALSTRLLAGRVTTIDIFPDSDHDGELSAGTTTVYDKISGAQRAIALPSAGSRGLVATSPTAPGRHLYGTGASGTRILALRSRKCSCCARRARKPQRWCCGRRAVQAQSWH